MSMNHFPRSAKPWNFLLFFVRAAKLPARKSFAMWTQLSSFYSWRTSSTLSSVALVPVFLSNSASVSLNPSNSAEADINNPSGLTIGVELVAKPGILIFLDEPTSGLDGQAANNTVRFLRKLAEVGQAVLVTIHQPSADLFTQFDTLLLLAKGGKTVYFGDIGHNAQTVKEYFAGHGAPCPRDANPAEHMIEVVSGGLSKGKDWNQVWLNSPEHVKITKELDSLVAEAAAKPPGTIDDSHQFAAPMWEQVKLVTHRMNISLFRNTEYINNKLILHVLLALYNGFSFWSIGNSISGLQQRLFTVFSFLFVAPGLISQLQPIFIDRRNVYETREKKSKTYHWVPFVTGLIVSELPYLVVCAVLYFVCWYWTAGLPNESKWAGSTFFVAVSFLLFFFHSALQSNGPSRCFTRCYTPVLVNRSPRTPPTQPLPLSSTR